MLKGAAAKSALAKAKADQAALAAEAHPNDTVVHTAPQIATEAPNKKSKHTIQSFMTQPTEQLALSQTTGSTQSGCGPSIPVKSAKDVASTLVGVPNEDVAGSSAFTPEGNPRSKKRGRAKGSGQQTLAEEAAQTALAISPYIASLGTKRTRRPPPQFEPTGELRQRSRTLRDSSTTQAKSSPAERQSQSMLDEATEMVGAATAVANALLAAAPDGTGSCCAGHPPLQTDDLVHLMAQHMSGSWQHHDSKKRPRPSGPPTGEQEQVHSVNCTMHSVLGICSVVYGIQCVSCISI